MTQAPGLDGLPVPAVVEELDYEEILNALVTDFRNRYPAYSMAAHETDPFVMLAQAAAYRETLVRAHINDAARANLRSFATGPDLDHLAEFYGLARLDAGTPGAETLSAETPGAETDTRLNERLTLAIYGRSAAGPKERYEGHARGVDQRIIEAHVYRTGAGPALECAVLTSHNNGIPDADLLTRVNAALNADDIRSINDRITAVAAVRRDVDIEADVRLLPDTPQDVLDALGAILREAWAEYGRIGTDLALSWITARLHGAGVARVTVLAPASDIVVDGHEAIAIGTVTLNDMGRTR